MQDYPKHDGFHCFEDKSIEEYSTLLEAEIACTAKPDCGMIYDDSCDGDNYWVCPSSATVETSTEGSCLYVNRKRFITINQLYK